MGSEMCIRDRLVDLDGLPALHREQLCQILVLQDVDGVVLLLALLVLDLDASDFLQLLEKVQADDGVGSSDLEKPTDLLDMAQVQLQLLDYVGWKIEGQQLISLCSSSKKFITKVNKELPMHYDCKCYVSACKASLTGR